MGCGLLFVICGSGPVCREPGNIDPSINRYLLQMNSRTDMGNLK
jgi:hypothetical protein